VVSFIDEDEVRTPTIDTCRAVRTAGTVGFLTSRAERQTFCNTPAASLKAVEDYQICGPKEKHQVDTNLPRRSHHVGLQVGSSCSKEFSLGRHAWLLERQEALGLMTLALVRSHVSRKFTGPARFQ
jgi:hypothetical protein